MATQSLYRRYRPRRFSEMRGQEHVVRALRTAVAEGREGQAYLFSGPRGTGKTTSARILAKVLNCENPVDGEPCCECESCLAVERGTSYDVHELDAASNNGVDAMRDLIDKALLGTPGRHKVYILDEVHMLSKAAEAALLKTLEEPPPHVVFVLATTDPQKMSDTIRSRTQHLQFHLLPADVLQAHVRWVADDAGLDVSDDALAQVLAKGGGSARDALSALELVSTTGGDGAEVVPVGEFVEAMIDDDAGRALATVARAISLGSDPRSLAEAMIGQLRNGFLALMAPELVQLPAGEVEVVAEQARRLGPPGLVRGIEVLGSALAEMRHAPDPRVLLDVAAVQLTTPSASTDVAALVERIGRLERKLADGAAQAPRSSRSSPVAPGSTSDVAASAAASDVTSPDVAASPAVSDVAASPAASDVTSPDVAASPAVSDAASDVAAPTAEGSGAPTGRATLGGRAKRAAARSAAMEDAASAAPPASPGEPAPPPPPAAEPGPALPAGAVVAATWEETIKPGLKGMARAVYAPAVFVTATESGVVLSLPNDVHRGKCEQHRGAVEAALSAHAGSPVTLELVVGDGSAPVETSPAGTGAAPAAAAVPADDEIDLDELVDAPPESVKTPIDRLAEAFPGSELVDERD